ncbi:MAG: 50S ribosomal protein L15 [Candidatus Margulisiibacteriota bacterium]
MKRNQVKPADGSIQVRKRVARGNASGWGGEAGRGHKGAKSRTGYSSKPGFEGGQMPLYRRLPKKRGFRSLTRVDYEIVNLQNLAKLCQANEIVGPEDLIRRFGLNPRKPIKVLGTGELAFALHLQVHAISGKAQEKVLKAGGKVQLLG